MNYKKDKKRQLLPSSLEVGNSEMGKLPPQALEEENAVLGAVLLENEAYHKVADLLHPEIFYKEQNQLICEAIISLKNKGEELDILTVTRELKESGQLDLVGGAYYISNLTNRIASSANIETHIRAVWQEYIKRNAIMASTILIKNAYESGADCFDIMDEYEKNLTVLTSKLFTSKTHTFNDLFSKFLEENQLIINSGRAITGITTGFNELDFLTNGLQKTDMIVLAARPGMGKTALMLRIARHAAVIDKKKVGIISMEMSAMQLFKRILSQETEIPLDNFLRKGLDEGDLKLLNRDIAGLLKTNILIDDTGGQTIFDIKTKARKWLREEGLDILFIDYLQLINGDGKGNREQEISIISRSIKALAKELEIPIVPLSQLSRTVESRGGDKVPQLSDLRDSGAIEQDADMVMFIYRPEYYGLTQDADGNSTSGVAKTIIAKNRNGQLGDIDLRWISKCTKFVNWNSTYGELSDLNNNDSFLSTNNPIIS